MKIVGFAGKKQSGKTTATRFITGCVLLDLGLVSSFKLVGDDIIVPTEDGEAVYDNSYPDNTNISLVWPCVQTVNLADSLKRFAISILGIDASLVYGSDDDKNTLTRYSWEQMPTKTKNTGIMTVRDSLQYWGTDVFRKIYPDVWVDSLLNGIKEINTQLLMIGDIRFPNEVEAIKKAGGTVIKLTKASYADTHDSERALDPDKFDQSKFDFIIDNKEMTLEQKNNELITIFKKLHIFDESSSVNYIS